MIHRKRSSKSTGVEIPEENFLYHQLIGSNVMLNCEVTGYVVKKIIQELLFLRNQLPCTYKSLKEQYREISSRKKMRRVVRSSEKKMCQLYLHFRELKYGLNSFFEELLPVKSTDSPILIICILGPSILFPKEVYAFRIWTRMEEKEKVEGENIVPQDVKNLVKNSVIKQFIIQSINFSSRFSIETKIHIIGNGDMKKTPKYFSPYRKAKCRKKKNLKFFLFDLFSSPDNNGHCKKDFLKQLDDQFFNVGDDISGPSSCQWYISNVSSKMKGFRQKK